MTPQDHQDVPKNAEEKAAAVSPREKNSYRDKNCKTKEDALMCELLGLMREIRAKIQNVRVSLLVIREKNKIGKTDERTRQLQVAWDENKPIIDENLEPVTQLLQKFSPTIFESGYSGQCLYDWYGDEITQIETSWDRFCRLWRKYRDSQEDILGKIDELDQILSSIILRINTNTIPDRVKEHLETLWPGQPLDFYDTFDDEICDKESGKKVLKFIESHPGCVNGIVDSTNGVIYKIDQRFWRRAFSFIAFVALILFGLGIAYSIPSTLQATQYPFSVAIPPTVLANATTASTSVDFSTVSAADIGTITTIFSLCYIFIIAGACAHILISSLKQLRTNQSGNVLAVEGWCNWFHVKEISNWVAVISLWVGFAGLLVVLKTTDYVTAFFVGYSLDSFIDLFLTRFSDTVTAKNTEITKKIQGDAGTTTG